MPPIPIVVVGRNPVIAAGAKQTLLPDYDVIHMILSENQGVSDLPFLLSNPIQAPPNSSTNGGSRNYSAGKVYAVTAGGGFSDEQFQMVRNSCKDVEDGVVWLRPDMSKITGMPPMSDAEAFGQEIGRRVKSKLNELGVGTEGGIKSGVHYWSTVSTEEK